MKSLILTFLAIAVAVVSSAQAQTRSAVTAEELESILADAGLSPSLTEDAQTGAPVATGTAGEFDFYVRALGCSGKPTACENLVFFANFEIGRDVDDSDYRAVNSFNDSQVFGRAYVIPDKREVGVDYVVELSGGVTEEHLSENISRWADVITDFVRKFAEGQSTS